MLVESKREQLREGLQVPLEELSDNQKKLLEWDSPGFDLRTHINDPRTGRLLKYQPYRRTVDKAEVIYYRKDEKGIERRYFENGFPIDPPQEGKAKAHDKKLSA